MIPSVGSLFSGIGGIDLGLERAGFQTKWQVENNEYCRKVLTKHWPTIPKYEDIKTLDFATVEPVDLLAGGFPCQPVSQTGKKKWKYDERWLWPEFFMAISILRPSYVLIENVPGLLYRGMGDVLRDLASIRYDAEWESIPAGAFGAHFRGDRVFIIANSPTSTRCRLQGWPFHQNKRCWSTEEFKRLVFTSLQFSVSAGKRGRVSDGIPYRVDRLRGLGNACVPQVVEWIGKQILRELTA